MKAKTFLRLPLLEQVEQLKKWTDNMDGEGDLVNPDADFDEWARDTLDVCIFPFPADSTVEKITDQLIAGLGLVDGMKWIRQAAVRFVDPVLDGIADFAPLAKLADKLPD